MPAVFHEKGGENLEDRRGRGVLGVDDRVVALVRRPEQLSRVAGRAWIVRVVRRVVRIELRTREVLLAARVGRGVGGVDGEVRVEERRADLVVLRLDADRTERAPLDRLRALRHVEQARLEPALVGTALRELGHDAVDGIDHPRVVHAVVVVRRVALVEDAAKRADLDAFIELPLAAARGRPLVVGRRRARVACDRIGPALADEVGRDAAVGIVAPERQAPARILEELVVERRLRVELELALELEARLVGDVLEVDVDRAARRVALLVGREGLAHLHAAQHRGRELVELHRAALGVRGRKAHALELRGRVVRERRCARARVAA